MQKNDLLTITVNEFTKIGNKTINVTGSD